MTDKDNESGKDKFAKNYGQYIGLGLQLAITVTVMAFIGIWLDKKFNTSPYLTIVCSFFGVFAGLYNFIKSVIKSGK